MASTFFQQASMNGRSVPKPGSHWQPAEDAKLMGLLASGKHWTDISSAIPGRSAISCARHYRQTLARKVVHVPKSNEIIQACIRHRVQIWEGIAEKVSLPWQEVETIFLCLYQERPSIIETAITERDMSLPSYEL
ncbi:hypothetical protein BJ170DRAFT_646087 [Xylariales sp. AK1849]|nr:hypothetical protein BJ170DRAFT_646087 [Xylariales sp. AK1849]